MSQRGALTQARIPVWLLRTSVKANRAKRNPGANTSPRVMKAKVVSPEGDEKGTGIRKLSDLADHSKEGERQTEGFCK